MIRLSLAVLALSLVAATVRAEGTGGLIVASAGRGEGSLVGAVGGSPGIAGGPAAEVSAMRNTWPPGADAASWAGSALPAAAGAARPAPRQDALSSGSCR